ncbi:MAG TPA: hypothetical protein PK509_18020 [Catalimonadaceae bacterium]|nr:hypothetical protein [Catalimonadaceae bacterium]
MKERNVRQKLAALALGGLVLLNLPILGTVNKLVLVSGIPLLFWYLFGVWFLLLVLLFRLSRKEP